MAGSVEAVTADAVLLIILVGDGVGVSLLRHSHTEGGIKYSYVGGSGHSLLAGFDAHQVRGIVQGSQFEALADYALYIIIYNDGIAVYGAAVKHSVADGGDLAGILDHAVLRIL